MFTEGQKVTWTSQSGGYEKVKFGIVAEVVKPGRLPDPERFPYLYKSAGIGASRDHQSYVVLVGSRPYWPRVNKLRSAE